MEGLNTHVLLTTSSQICTRTSFWYKNIYSVLFKPKKGNRAITKTKAQRSIHNGIMNLSWRMKH